MRETYNFTDGLAYCEAFRVYTEAYEENKKKRNIEDRRPLISSTGHYMILIRWKVTDCVGKTGFIDDYISEKADFKIKNLENALGISSIFDPVCRIFHAHEIRLKACGCTIRKDVKNPEYGSKIISYVPLQFYVAIAGAQSISNVA